MKTKGDAIALYSSRIYTYNRVDMNKRVPSACAYCKRYDHNINYCPKITCERCKHSGHTAAVCMATDYCERCATYGHLLNTACEVCRRHGHFAYECKANLCDRCGKSGHKTQACWYCDYCEIYGHRTSDCWFCDKCQQHGHTAEYCEIVNYSRCPRCSTHHAPDECAIRVPETRPAIIAAYCEYCEQSGHLEQTCEQKRFCKQCLTRGHSTSNCRATPYCYACETDTHFTGECPNKKMSKCARCHRSGHIARECSLDDLMRFLAPPPDCGRGAAPSSRLTPDSAREGALSSRPSGTVLWGSTTFG